VTAYFRSPRPPRTVGRNKNTFQYRKYGQPPPSIPDKHRRELQRVGKATAKLSASWNGSDKHYEKLEQLHADAERAYAKLARDE
jgi:hypothetical protein